MTYPQALKDHLGQGVTTVCRCWKLTRAGGTVSGFTDHDSRLEVDGLSCEPQSGFSASEAKASLGLTADAQDIEGALSSAAISDEDIDSGALDGAEVETFLVNWREPAQFASIGRAMIGKIVRRDGSFVAELESRMRFLDQPNGRYIMRRCDAELGDARCGVALAGGFAGSGTVMAVDGAGVATVSGLGGFAAGLFTHGIVTFSSGRLAGKQVRVNQHRKAGADVLLAFEQMPVAGDAFTIVAGCDKSFATCKTKFSNAGNFRGFPHLPGNDQAYAVAREDGVFDGGPVVP